MLPALYRHLKYTSGDGESVLWPTTFHKPQRRSTLLWTLLKSYFSLEFGGAMSYIIFAGKAKLWYSTLYPTYIVTTMETIRTPLNRVLQKLVIIQLVTISPNSYPKVHYHAHNNSSMNPPSLLPMHKNYAESSLSIWSYNYSFFSKPKIPVWQHRWNTLTIKGLIKIYYKSGIH